MNSLTPETASTLSLTNDMEELDWYFQDIFDQFGNMYCLFDDINHLLDDCPLEFLLFEVQQLISFLQRHWYASHQCLQAKILCPLLYSLFLWDLCPPRLWNSPNLPCLIPSTRTTRLLGSLSTLFDYLFHHLFLRTNPSRVMWQPGSCFCRIHYHWHCQLTPTLPRSDPLTNAAPISIATTTDTDSIQSQPAPQQNRRCTPPVTQIPHTYHNYAPLPITTPNTTPTVVHVPIPIPPISTSVICYVSSLIIQFNPCIGCGSADGHLSGCSIWSQGLQD